MKFIVQKVNKDKGSELIQHIGIFETEKKFSDIFGTLPQEERHIVLHIDAAKRLLFAKLHSAGHVLDAAVKFFLHFFLEFNITSYLKILSIFEVLVVLDGLHQRVAISQIHVMSNTH